LKSIWIRIGIDRYRYRRFLFMENIPILIFACLNSRQVLILLRPPLSHIHVCLLIFFKFLSPQPVTGSLRLFLSFFFSGFFLVRFPREHLCAVSRCDFFSFSFCFQSMSDFFLETLKIDSKYIFLRIIVQTHILMHACLLTSMN